ncbi:MAG: FAD-binding oxidoreductase [Burkholderiales bacterium]
MTPEPAATSERLRWKSAAVVAIEPRTPRIKSFFFKLPAPTPFIAGQHMELRLVAPDGYEARRSYSIASAPEQTDTIELAIERLEDGEVSGFFHDDVQVGDDIELRGPLGGHFIWTVADGGPLLLIGGGSGVVPLVSMLRHHAAQKSAVPIALVTSARTAADLAYLDELRALHAQKHGFALTATVTRETPPTADLHAGRIDPALLGQTLAALGTPLRTYVCGSNPFVETATGLLLDLKIPAERIRTERYGG